MSLTIVLRVGGLRANFAADFSSVPLAAGLENRDTEIPPPPLVLHDADISFLLS